MHTKRWYDATFPLRLSATVIIVEPKNIDDPSVLRPALVCILPLTPADRSVWALTALAALPAHQPNGGKESPIVLVHSWTEDV